MMLHLYGLIIGTAIVIGWGVAEKIEPRVNKVALLVLVCGLLGARLYHVVDLWEYYSHNLRQVVAVWNGGLGIFGGIAGGTVGLWLGVRKEQLGHRWQMASAIATGLPLSQAIGRWGNLVNDELWGSAGQPLFLYESVLDIALFILLYKMMKQKNPKAVVGLYFLGYGLIRLILDPLKVDPWWVGYFFSMSFIVIGVKLRYFSLVE